MFVLTQRFYVFKFICIKLLVRIKYILNIHLLLTVYILNYSFERQPCRRNNPLYLFLVVYLSLSNALLVFSTLSAPYTFKRRMHQRRFQEGNEGEENISGSDD